MTREDWEDLNTRFAAIGDRLGIQLETIHTGSQPGDGTGDTVSAATAKCFRNLLSVMEYDCLGGREFDPIPDFDSVPKEIARRSGINRLVSDSTWPEKADCVGQGSIQDIETEDEHQNT